MKHPMTLLQRLLPAALAVVAGPAAATNGMNMEGYGPISAALGGASQALEHGTAAMAQNPATLGMMGAGSRLDLAVGRLGPKVASSIPGLGSADSSGTAYYMPAVGYARRSGNLTWGVGLFAQGGMGTDYGSDTFLAMGSGQPVRSELGVGRVLFPLAWQVTPTLTVGGSVDLVWAGLDLRMAASGAQLGGMVTAASGNLAQALPALGGAPWARVDFSNSNDFTGAASSTGWAAKIGLVWRPTPELTVGASYQSESSLGDMKTSASGAALSAFGGFVDSGRITVVDFQWPSTAAIGVAWQGGPALLVADVKRIGWASVMKDFRMRYDSATMGGSVTFAMPQNWKDQTVLSLGGAWSLGPDLTLRAGYNHAANPIPDAYVNPLFPATVKTHYTLGLGWRLSAGSEFNGALTLAPASTVTNGQGVIVSHKQRNLQLMYSLRF